MTTQESENRMRLEQLRNATGLPAARLKDLEKRGFMVVPTGPSIHERMLREILDDLLDLEIGTRMYWKTDEELRRDAFAHHVHAHLIGYAQELGWDNADSSDIWDKPVPAAQRVAYEAQRRGEVLEALGRLFRSELNPIQCPACGGSLYWAFRTGGRYIKTQCDTCRIDEDLVANSSWGAARRG